MTTSHPSAERTQLGAPRAGGAGTLGRHTVSRIGYGAMQLARLPDDRAAAITVLRRAADLGADHVDTAQFYGDGYVNDLIRAAYRPEDGVIVVSKVGADPDPGARTPIRPAQRPEQLRASVEDNLRSLGLDQIPVVNLRRLGTTGPRIRATGDQVVALDDQLAAMAALRDEGKIGAIGLSGVTEDELRRALPAGIVCVQNAYSLVARDDEPTLTLCLAEGIAWMPFFPLGGAFPGMTHVSDVPAVVAVAESLGVTAAQVGLAWLLRHAPNTLLIPGTTSLAHLAANIAAGSVELPDDALAALDAAPTHSTDLPIDEPAGD
jgi:aryl-alcohol dehydrogenase-like predicted oxidoreductase